MLEQIHRRLKCQWKTAGRLLETFRTLDFDDRTTEHYINALIAANTGREKHAILSYLEFLADELKDFALSRPPEYENQVLFASTGDFKDAWMDTEVFHAKDQLDGSFCEWPLNRQAADTFSYLPLADEEGRVEPDQSCLPADTIGYHPIENSNGSESATWFNGHRAMLDITEEHEPFVPKDWTARQPLPFRTLIKFTKNCNYQNLKELAAIVKDTTWETFTNNAYQNGLKPNEIRAIISLIKGHVRPYNKWGDYNGAVRFKYRIKIESQIRVMDYLEEHVPPMTKAQTSVFWTWWKIRRSQLNMAPVTLPEVRPQGQKLLSMIFNSKSMGRLKYLGANMLKFSRNQIPGNKLTPPEWSTVWKAYNERKQDLQAAN